MRAFPHLPILGVCLGHQILGMVYGGEICRVSPVHGRRSSIRHDGHPLFRAIPSCPDYQVVRYHSLAVEGSSLPSCLRPIAWTSGGSCTVKSEKVRGAEERVLMGLAHRSAPHYGVQFHPESIGSRYGRQLLTNFQSLTHSIPFTPRAATCRIVRRPEKEAERKPTLGVVWKKIRANKIDTDALFDHLFGQNGSDDTFWLDRSVM